MEQPVIFNRIPVLDLGKEVEELKPQILSALTEVLDKGAFIMGENVTRFEEEAASYLGVRHAVALNSGTDALVLALLAVGVGPGDEVIVPPFTFFATAEAVSQVGATPVFADVNAHDFNINIASIEEHISARTKAIIPVHLFGQPADLDDLRRLADAHQLLIIEDTAQAFGAEYKGQKVSGLGDIGTLSFFPSKNLGTYGDGGMLVTNRADYADKVRKLRAHGSTKKYFNEMVGYNSRLDEMQAAILRVKLPYVTGWNEARRRVADVYQQQLKGISGLLLPQENKDTMHVYHQFTLRVQEGRRDELKTALDQKGISTVIYYPLPVHKLPVYAHLNLVLPVSEQLSSEVLSLPMGPYLDNEVQEYVCESIIEALR
ncbi:dTDP-4-amino-4,6-dideoxygalactose transaminase [Paenibacillus shirakamiensis]|uniref:dTDP-4-amino-4,6-dideoxygalactose transaminase n=1 Tax=Paenibacillus shirakamiensis TaxID=1265935 RepID=A0ABS4JJR2_9BACL|nr:DegT/DnrJ/EryC1/StrS family aminotransferase [Paenibacillus shirakamiensis]MBP2001951.1 dTDP-4-amino-4,6-dideoxygalactose transaminase [Paenibacillus shirakamiensis]